MPDRSGELLDDRLDAALGALADAGLDPAAQSRIEDAVDARLRSAGTVRRRSWLARHALLAAAGGLIAAGSVATAATLVLRGDPSHPTSGTIPRMPHEHRAQDMRYRISVTPELTVGQPGWCSSLQIRKGDDPHWFGGEGCGWLTYRRGSIGGGTTYMGKGRGILAYLIVDRTVASALTGRYDKPVRRILPISDPALPNGWRAIVQLPGETHTGNLRLRDADDRPLGGGPFVPSRDAVPQLTPETRLGAAPNGAPCTVGLPAGAVVRGSRWLREVPRIDRLPDRAVQSCLQTRFQVDGEWAEVNVLVDAAKPGEQAPLDVRNGGRPVTGLPGAVDRDFITFEPFDVPRIMRRPSFPIGVPATALGTVVARDNAYLVIRAESAALRHRLAREITVQVRS